MRKIALICGISGQDGALLTKLLLTKGYKVVGQTRKLQSSYPNLMKLGLMEKLDVLACDLMDKKAVKEMLLDVQPDEIYNLSGQSSVGLSFEKPLETFESHVLSVANVLEIIRSEKLSARFFNAGSGECYGSSDIAIEIGMPMQPVSPYAMAKAAALMLVERYREIYGIYACTGVLFNHESPLRSERFVTQKIISSAIKISQGQMEKLELGNLDVIRDWGWAEEYVEAMWLMLQQDKAEDFVISTGEPNSLEDFVNATFNALGLKWLDYVSSTERYMRGNEVHSNYGNPKAFKEKTGWAASLKMKGVIKKMLERQV
ncbi:MAG: GDP-mannose 4,6-dehydratase [Ghiorsea sp.]|nr:GDP-mannose 4,6-dehydratase [Ghiorsea sp.]